MAIIAPSILAADLAALGTEVSKVTAAGAEWIHIDVMDGKFVPPITFGPGIVKSIRPHTQAFLDVHLMIERPEEQIEPFIEAGAQMVTVHVETCPHLHRMVQRIHELGAKAGVALNPATSLSLVEPILDNIDLLLVMTVNPGWGGQSYIPESTAKIQAASQLIRNTNRKIHLEVDGGITDITAKTARDAGADVLVAGTYIFKSSDYKSKVQALRE